jgi:hypothetical protein
VAIFAGLAPVNEIECFAVGFSDCRHSAGAAPIESQGPVRIDSLLERGGFEPPRPFDFTLVYRRISL